MQHSTGGYCPEKEKKNPDGVLNFALIAHISTSIANAFACNHLCQIILR